MEANAVKLSLARAGTMELTANEGIDYLKSERKHTLLKFQGLVEDEPEKPAVNRDSSIQKVLKEAAAIIGEDKPNPDAQTRSQQKRLVESRESSGERPAKRVRLSKHSTMAATARESRYVLAGKSLARTRLRTRTRPSKSTKVAMKKTTTMARTLADAKYVLCGHPGVKEAMTTRSQRPDNSPRLFFC